MLGGIRRSWWGGSDDSNDEQLAKAAGAMIDGDGGDIESGEAEVVSNGVSRVAEGEDSPLVPSVVVLPIQRRPLFPGLVQPLPLPADEGLIEALKAQREKHPYVGVFLQNDGNSDPLSAAAAKLKLPTSPSDVHEIGTLAMVHRIVESEDSSHLLVMGQRRLRLQHVLDDGPPMLAAVENLYSYADDARSDLVKAYTNEIIATLRDVIRMNSMFKEHMQLFSSRFDVHDPFRLADFAATLTTADPEPLQGVLEAMRLEDRLERSLALLKQEREVSKLQMEIQSQVEEKMSENQRRYFLMEQLKHIKKELGMEKDDKEALISKFQERIADLDVPDDVTEVIVEETEKFQALERNSPEFNVTRNYLDWLTALPWGVHSEDCYDLTAAADILDAEHYGMKDVKERILEFIAVGKLNGSVQGKILCFVGPPGVGKTSIGQSIASSLGREFYRFSVGGLSDVAEIKGHRRTYVGAMPGKLIQCLKSTKTSNPVVLIDEIDKLDRSFKGDPASALLELLDPAQNDAFTDHYLDVPVDLSKVLFICTANVADTIPGPLLDRMEVLNVSGYDLPEKVAIAQQYLEPKAREEAGLPVGRDGIPPGLQLTEDALESLARWYCRESGVRNLEKHIARIYRKAALNVVKADDELLVDDDHWRISEDKLVDYVGQPKFTSDRLFDAPPPGVVMGLAWTAMGGASLYIETIARAGKSARAADGDEDASAGLVGGGALATTGRLGETMQESSRIAYAYARSWLDAADSDNSFFDSHNSHLHVPEGATPKDGPSAGITMVTSLLSLAQKRPVPGDLAMTGEVTLTGLVLPVGGIKEKTIAARRAGVTTIIYPDANRKDYDELPDYLKDGLNVHFAKTYDDVAAVVFSE
eukprot:PLAT5119.1.p1 GENE.PLAT5119.1~~PLAT5119.1.p1  ORF type:complete len:890 (+),score=512.53 PLAT5119.1:56-2671(+)